MRLYKYVEVKIELSDVLSFISNCHNNDFNKIKDAVGEIVMNESCYVVIPTHDAHSQLQSEELKELIELKGVDFVLNAIKSYKE